MSIEASRMSARPTAIALGLIALLAAGYLVQTRAVAQNGQEPATAQQDAEKADSMNCPMMTSLQGIKLHADSPPLLVANAETMKLTADQKQELQKIAEEARRKARKVLTAEQRQQLGEETDEAMPIMQVAMMRAQEKNPDKQGSKKMCPMCTKMMKEKKQVDD